MLNEEKINIKSNVFVGALEKYKNMSVPLKASLWFTICSIVQKGISFFTVPIFSRILSTSDYGYVSIYNSWMGIISIFVTLNLQYGVFNTAMAKFENDRERFISSMQGLILMISTCFFSIYLLGNAFWNSVFSLSTIVMVMMFIEMMSHPALGFWSAKNRYEFQYKRVVAITLILTIVSPIAGLIAVFGAEDKGTARIIASSLVSAVIGISIFFVNLKKGKTLYVKEYWIYALKFNIPLIPYYLSQVVFNQTDRLMIAKMCGNDKAGIYNVAYAIGTILLFVLNAINSSLVPWIYEKMKKKDIKKISGIINIILIFWAAMLYMLVLFAPEIMKIMAPSEYYEAIWVIPPVILGNFFLFISQLAINVMFFYEENICLTKGSIISAIVNVVLNYLLIERVGYIVAGYTTLVSYILFAVINFLYVRKIIIKKGNMGISKLYNVKFIITFCMIYSIIVLITSLSYSGIVVRYVLIVAIGIACIIKRKLIGELVNKVKKK